jgi:hypothetical protein
MHVMVPAEVLAKWGQCHIAIAPAEAVTRLSPVATLTGNLPLPYAAN